MIVRKFLLGTALLFWALSAYAQTQVLLQGILPGRALLSINGGAPTSVGVGKSVQGIKVLSLAGDSAVVEIEGRKTTLRLGEGAVGSAVAPREETGAAAGRAVLQSDGRGHFVAQGTINGKSVSMLIDTGASLTVLPANEANRLRIDYRARGTPGAANTANGRVQTWNLSLDSVRVQGITLYNVPASVIEAPLNTILLGNSFLNRVQMQREGETMVLVQRF